MKYSVLGFNQQKVMETNLGMTDLMILRYIIDACGSPNMKYRLSADEKPLVWLYHAKLIEDLPIIRISESTLRNRLAALKKDGFITSVTVSSEVGRGSRTYYGITDATVSLIYDTENMTASQNNDTKTRPHPKKMTPDSILEEDNNKNTISKDIVLDTQVVNTTNDETIKTEKPKKLSMYDKCINTINEYSDNIELRELLTEYLKMRLSVKDKPLYGVNQFKGILKKLDTLGGDKFEIVNYCIERGYLSFYAPTNYNKDRGVSINSQGIKTKSKFGEFGSMSMDSTINGGKENVLTGRKI